MIARPASHRQLDLLVPTATALDLSRLPRPTRAAVTALLKLLISAHIAADAALPPEAVSD